MKQTTLWGAVAAAATLLSAQGAFAQQVKVESEPSYNGTTTEVKSPAATTRVSTSPNGSVVTVTVDNEKVAFEEDSQPQMIGGRVMVPLRGVIERLGGNVLYEAKTKVITGANANTNSQFRMRVGSNEVIVNGENKMLDAMPRVIAGTTYVPLRFVSEALGADVSWDNATRTVTIEAAGSQAKVKAG